MRYDPKRKKVALLAGGTKGYEDGTNLTAKFNSPTGICLDNDGNILVTDQLNCKVRKIKVRDGTISTVAGTEEGFEDGEISTAKFSSTLSGICVDPSGTIFVCDTRNHRIRRIKDGKVDTLSGDVVALDHPAGLCCDKSGSLFVADSERIIKLNPTTQQITIPIVFEKKEVPIMPVGLCVDKHGNLIVTDKYTPSLRGITKQGEGDHIDLNCLVEEEEDGKITKVHLKELGGVCATPAGEIIVLDNGSHQVRCILCDGKGAPFSSLSSQAGSLVDEIQVIKKEMEILKQASIDKDGLLAEYKNLIQKRDQDFITLQKELEKIIKDNELFKKSFDLVFSKKRGFKERQSLSMTEPIVFMAPLKMNETGSLDEHLKKMYPRFPNLDKVHVFLNTWYSFRDPTNNPDGLTEDEIKAIGLYTHDHLYADRDKNFYAVLNNMLKTRASSDMVLIGGYLSHLFRAISKLKDVHTTLFRGIPNTDKGKTIEKDYITHKPIFWSRFSSGTKSIAVAKEFAGEGGTILAIKVYSAKAITSYSMINKEELILHPNLKFKVVKGLHKREDHYCYVALEEER
uniref:NAD(+)--protein-arginine ADP-ribosyltransferase n=1 Tax=Arcella intermedia TaxID=1963864 RepID=A0A6B2L0F0_9EUKA